MIARSLSLAISLALSIVTLAQDVSPGVRYKRAKPEVNNAFKRLLHELHDMKLGDKELRKMFEGAVISGPNLYGVLKRQLPEAAKSGKLAKVFVPVDGKPPEELEGRFYNTPADILDFGRTVQGLVASEPMKIRIPSKAELDYYWAMIPYDIEEPIFVAESSNWSLLFNGMSNGRIFYVELLPRKLKGRV